MQCVGDDRHLHSVLSSPSAVGREAWIKFHAAVDKEYSTNDVVGVDGRQPNYLLPDVVGQSNPSIGIGVNRRSNASGVSHTEVMTRVVIAIGAMLLRRIRLGAGSCATLSINNSMPPREHKLLMGRSERLCGAAQTLLGQTFEKHTNAASEISAHAIVAAVAICWRPIRLA